MEKVLRVDVDKLKGNSADNYILAQESIDSEQRLRGLIENDVSFSAIVYGYRGTGKSSFVKYILKEFKDDRVIINFNATKYDDYEKFLRRFIRELYLAVNEKEKKSEAKEKKGLLKAWLNKKNQEKDKYDSNNLKKIYRHTFFNITESFKTENVKTTDASVNLSLSKDVGFEWVIDLATVLGFIALAAFAPRLIKLFGIVVGAKEVVFYLAAMAIILGAANLTIKMAINVVSKISFSSIHKKNNATTEESFYDNEIAEYHVFNELKKISKNGKKVIFVLDELDKLEEDTIKTIIKDLKSLILSEDIITILVAGRNYEKYWDKEKGDTDGIASSLFAQKVYIPLAETKHLRDIIESLFVESDRGALKDTEYISEKIMKSEGVIRELINLVVNDIKWSEGKHKGKAYVKIGEDSGFATDITAQKSYLGLERVEDLIRQRDRVKQYPKTDEMYKLAYKISRYVIDHGLRFEDDDRKKVYNALKQYLKGSATHLSTDDVNLVFEAMFPKELENISALVDEEVVNAVDNKVDQSTLYDIVYRKYRKDFSDKELQSLQELVGEIFTLFTLFADYLNETLMNVLSMCNLWYSRDLFKWNSDPTFDDYRKVARQKRISYEEFIDNLVKRYFASHVVSSADEEMSRLDIVTFLLKLYLWKEQVISRNSFGPNITGMYSLWDIQDINDKHMSLVEVKYYKMLPTGLAVNETLREKATATLKYNLAQTANVALVLLVPELIDKDIKKSREMLASTVVHADNPNVQYSVCYLPYDNQEHFSAAMDKFKECLEVSITKRNNK